MISSQKDSFLKAYKEGKNFIPIIQTWPADLETPLSTWLKLSSKDSHGVFLESVEGGESLGNRYKIFTFFISFEKTIFL